MENAIKYLYSQFILRDVLSSIMPGAIVVLTAFLILLPEPTLKDSLETLLKYSRSMHWLLFIPLFGLFYATGFAVECLERLFGCVRLHTLDNASFKQRLSIFCGNWRKKADIYKEFRESAFQFLWMSRHQDWAGQNYERLVVLKQMCANSFGAIVIAGLFLIVDTFCTFRYANVSITFLITILLLVALYWGYRDFTIEATTMEEKLKSLENEEKLKEGK